MAEYVIVLTKAFTKFTFPVQQVTSPPAPWSKLWYVIGSLFMVFIITFTQTKEVALQLK